MTTRPSYGTQTLVSRFANWKVMLIVANYYYGTIAGCSVAQNFFSKINPRYERKRGDLVLASLKTTAPSKLSRTERAILDFFWIFFNPNPKRQFHFNIFVCESRTSLEHKQIKVNIGSG